MDDNYGDYPRCTLVPDGTCYCTRRPGCQSPATEPINDCCSCPTVCIQEVDDGCEPDCECGCVAEVVTTRG